MPELSTEAGTHPQCDKESGVKMREPLNTEMNSKNKRRLIDSPLPELGVDIMKAYQNQGYGPEAIVAFCNWYSVKFGLHKVKVRIQKENAHSIHMFEKLGAEYNV